MTNKNNRPTAATTATGIKDDKKYEQKYMKTNEDWFSIVGKLKF